ncbi:MAG: hypothetical protein R6X03_02670 [Methyloceanibacter sp.]
MTIFVKTALCAALAATLSLAAAPADVEAKSFKGASAGKITTKRGHVAVHPVGRSNRLTIGTQGQAAGKNNTFCGNADVFVIYDEDANGNPVPGTEQYGCTD